MDQTCQEPKECREDEERDYNMSEHSGLPDLDDFAGQSNCCHLYQTKVSE
jgi:hypothetical protein